MKFVSKEKMNKKALKELNAKKRGDWGLVKPVTKVVPSKKTYNRQAFKKAC